MRLEDVRRELDARGLCQIQLRGASDEDLVALAEQFGQIVREVRDPRLIRAVSPSSTAAARENTLSSRYGFGAFPFHTDTAYWREPASLLFLYCVDPGGGARRTLVSDTRGWVLSDDQRAMLLRSLWKVQRQREAFFTCLAYAVGADLRIRYDVHCMSAVGSESADAAFLVERQASESHVEIAWAAGDLLILDNRRSVHARTAAIHRDPERILKRILVHTDA